MPPYSTLSRTSQSKKVFLLDSDWLLLYHMNQQLVQGRELSAEDIGLIQGLMTEHRTGEEPGSGRACHRWDWRNARGRIKDMAARSCF